MDTFNVPRPVRAAGRQVVTVTTEWAAGEQPTEETVGTTQTQTQAERGSGTNTENPPPAYSAATDPTQPEVRAAGQVVNPPDRLTTRTVDQPVVQTPDQPPVQAPDPPTPPESRVVGEPTQRVDRPGEPQDPRANKHKQMLFAVEVKKG